jgi:hypothetical protein
MQTIRKSSAAAKLHGVALGGPSNPAHLGESLEPGRADGYASVIGAALGFQQQAASTVVRPRARVARRAEDEKKNPEAAPANGVISSACPDTLRIATADVRRCKLPRLFAAAAPMPPCCRGRAEPLTDASDYRQRRRPVA